MRRADLKPDTVYRIVPWRGSAASYKGDGAYCRTPDTIVSSGAPGASAGAIVMRQLDVTECDGYTVPTPHHQLLANGIRPAAVIEEVCPVAAWPEYLERIAEVHRHLIVDQDAAVLNRRQDVTLILAGLLGNYVAADRAWWNFIEYAVGDMDSTHRRQLALIIGLRGGDHIGQAEHIVRAIINGDRDRDKYGTLDGYTARRIFGRLSTEEGQR
jgi:hypothetical protein